MCGIAGLISIKPQSSHLIASMTDCIRHRGPDDEGFVIFTDQDITISGGADTPKNCYDSRYPYSPSTKIENIRVENASLMLGHRRLSVIDVSPAGHQPMCSLDSEYWIVYNGEIYNYLDLRVELQELGVTFISQTDTEVILAAYKIWGRKCLNRFNGMFSFIVYDRKNRLVFGARDRFGVKPFYYWITDCFLAFASEIKQFTKLPGWKTKINGQRSYDY